jgi:predicted DNA-binding protein (MmcQ/YjbR family)
VARQEPLLYFVTGARNPTRYEGMMQGIRERQEAEILRALEDLRYVVMSEIDGPATGYYAKELPAVHAYLERHFRIAPGFPLDKHQWIVVYERGPDRGAAAFDLVEAAEQGRYWLEGPTGRTEVPAEEVPWGLMRHLRRPLGVPLGPDGGGVDFELEVPGGARFEAGVGIFGMRQTSRRWPATYTVSVVVDGEERELARLRLPPDPTHGTWQPLVADLSAYAGQRVTLRLRVVPEARDLRKGLGWWGSPRVFVPPGAAS